MQNIPEIKFEEISGVGLITLTRQKALNALNHAMFLALKEQLGKWNKAENIKTVVIQAEEGRAFCAGGDIRHAYELKKASDDTIYTFFHDEYQMNKIIHHFSKPYVALLNGITMGGGVGISLHGSQRVATEKLLFSMPETGIGFYPDVGTTYYLSRYPHFFGYYLGLTGARINADDCAAIGIVDEIVKSDDLPKIISELVAAATSDKNAVTQLLKKFSVPIKHASILEHKTEIENCFSKNTVEEILQALESYGSEWTQQIAASMKTKSPTSLKVTLHALQKAKKLNFDECMQMEYRLTCRFIQEHDFFEGIRAVVIDKDQKPQWKPAILEEVTMPQIEKYFAPLEKEFV